MTAHALANATAHAVVAVAAKIYARIRLALLRFAAAIAETRIHKARLEAEAFRNRYRLRSKSDDDLPVVL
jgi:hypothetical protein